MRTYYRISTPTGTLTLHTTKPEQKLYDVLRETPTGVVASYLYSKRELKKVEVAVGKGPWEEYPQAQSLADFANWIIHTAEEGFYSFLK